jgi:hypothetical protein
VHKGKYPLYRVWASVVGIAEDRRIRSKKDISLEEIYLSGEPIEIGDFGANATAKRPMPEPLIRSKNFDSNIYYIARNGSWMQMLRRRYIKDKWLTATQVFIFTPPRGDRKKLFDSVDPNYPTDNNGKVNWD